MELEAVEKQIRDLVERQTLLTERRAALETSRAHAHKSGVSIQSAANSPTTSTLCVSLHRPGAHRMRSSQMSFTPAPRATTSPPPVFEISTRNRFAPFREMEHDTVIIGDSIIRHVRATLAEGKVHTHCFPGARVLDVSAQIPAILKVDESPGAVNLRFSSRISLYLASFIFPSIATSHPVPVAEKHPHSMLLPPPCFTVGAVLDR
uniref:Uncharacterized protein n=1 Tax=Sinocyclocheilus anshuiensis TaxID=1608454 RepID=A0A671PPP0_9TELE